MRRYYAVQITEGKGTEFLWEGQALGDGHTLSRACDAFEHDRGRRPSHEVISLEALPTSTPHHEKPAFCGFAGLPRVGDPGFEPGTSSLSEKRSNQLS